MTKKQLVERANVYLDVDFQSLCRAVNSDRCVDEKLQHFLGALGMALMIGSITEEVESSLFDAAYFVAFGV